MKIALFAWMGVLLMAGTAVVSGKAHVPFARAQICTSGGVVRNVSLGVMQTRITTGGACRLTACAFNQVDSDGDVTKQFVFGAGSSCDSTDVSPGASGNGWCDATEPLDVSSSLDAINVTPACHAITR